MDSKQLHILLGFVAGQLGESERVRVRDTANRDPAFLSRLRAVERIRGNFEGQWAEFAHSGTNPQASAESGTSLFWSRIHAWIRWPRELFPDGLGLVPAFQGTAGIPRTHRPSSIGSPDDVIRAHPYGSESALLRIGERVVGKLIHEESEKRLSLLVFLDRFPVRKCHLVLVHEGARLSASRFEEVEGAPYALATFDDVPPGATIHFEITLDLPDRGGASS